MRMHILDGVLSNAHFYQWFQDAIGGTRAREWTRERFVGITPGQRVLDLGCGPGDFLRLLPRDAGIQYTGIDASDVYVARAQRQQRAEASFVVGDCTRLEAFVPDGAFDWILCMGLLHHLDDAQCEALLRGAARALAPGGTVICLEPVLYPDQSRITQAIMGQDRGAFMRSAASYRELCARWFRGIDLQRLRGAFRIPYESTVLTLRQPRLSTPEAPRATTA